MRKKILALSLAVCLVLSFFPVLAASAQTTDNDGFILIRTADELSNIRNNPTGWFRLADDINLSGIDWEPIGTNTTSGRFQGILDGNGHTIWNLTVPDLGSRGTRLGLFGTTSGATIRNLHLRGGSVTRTTNNTNNRAGSLIGHAEGSLTLSNITSNVTVTARSSAGGLIGRGNFNGARITNVTFFGTVQGMSDTGGIIGNVTASSSAQSSTISESRVVFDPERSPHDPLERQDARIRGTTDVGGIVGAGSGITIEKSYTTVSITGSSHVGGIIGNMQNTSRTIIQDSFSTGNITSTASNASPVGGIAGRSTGTASIINRVIRTYSTSFVMNDRGTHTGGIVGRNGTTSTESHVAYNFAINREIRQNSASATATGRIGGTDHGFRNNHARDDLRIFWRNGVLQNISGTLNTNQGQSAAYSSLRTITPYHDRGWNISSDPTDNSVWLMDSSVSPYPVLRWSVTPPRCNICNEFLSNCVCPPPCVICGQYPSICPRNCVECNEPLDDCECSDTLAIVLEVGESVRLTGLLNRNPADMTGFVWASDNTSVAEVAQNGRVTAAGLGVARITAARGNIILGIYILVQEPEVEEITFDPDVIHMYSGDNRHFSGHIPEIYPSNATNQSLTWSSNNTDIVFVNTSGTLTAGYPGTIEITATASNGVTGILTVVVSNPVENVTLTQTDHEFDISDTFDLSLLFEYEVAVRNSDFIDSPGYENVEWHFRVSGDVNSSPSPAVTYDADNRTLTINSEGRVYAWVAIDDIRSNVVSFTIGEVEPPVQYTIAAWQVGSKPNVQTDFPLRTTPTIGASDGRSIGSNANQFTLTGWLSVGRYLYVEIDTTGLSSITINVSSGRGPANPGEMNFILQYSFDGGEWQNAGANGEEKTILLCNSAVNANSSGSLNDFELPENSENRSNLRIRWKNLDIAAGAIVMRDIVITGMGSPTLSQTP